MPQRRVLVLGARGMLGQACFDRLRAESSLRVDQIARQGLASPWSIEIPDDIHRLWSLLRSERYDLLVNCIAVLRTRSGGDQAASIREMLRINAVFPHDLAEQAAAVGSRLVHISSDALFGGSGRAPYDETSRPAPTDTYAASKWLGEP